MISVDAIVTVPARDLPALFEVPLMSGNFITTLWLTASPMGSFVRVSDVESGDYIDLRGEDEVTILKPEDVSDPVVQAELITALADRNAL